VRGVGVCIGLLLPVAAFGGQARLVMLNVAAEDGRGQPVRDLQQSDFTVSDAGKTEKIVLFRKTGEQAAEAADPLGPGEFSNRATAAPPRVTVVLLDLLNAGQGEESYAGGQLLEALKKLGPAEYLYVYVLTLKGVLPIAPLPDAGDEEDGRGRAPTPAEIGERLNSVLKTEIATRDYLFAEDRVKATVAGLETLAAPVGTVAGRKNLVWLTHGVPIQVDPGQTEAGMYGYDYTPMMRQMSAVLDAQGISMYPVRLSGPSVGGRMYQMDEETIQEMAAMTGGRAFLGPDVVGAIRKALEDGRSSYVIGYFPAPESWDGKLHKIKVKCSRKGVKLVAKTEYIAYPPEQTEEAMEDTVLRSAALSPFDATGIGVTVKVSAGATKADAVLDVKVRAQDVIVAPARGGWLSELSVNVFELAPDGSRKRVAEVTMDSDLTAPQREEAMKNGLEKRVVVGMDPGITRLRVVVYDEVSGAVGSVTIPSAGNAGP
jgi:VWFA-related protein